MRRLRASQEAAISSATQFLVYCAAGLGLCLAGSAALLALDALLPHGGEAAPTLLLTYAFAVYLWVQWLLWRWAERWLRSEEPFALAAWVTFLGTALGLAVVFEVGRLLPGWHPDRLFSLLPVYLVAPVFTGIILHVGSGDVPSLPGLMLRRRAQPGSAPEPVTGVVAPGGRDPAKTGPVAAGSRLPAQAGEPAPAGGFEASESLQEPRRNGLWVAGQGLVDYHTHTFRCGHATGEVEEYVEAAIAAGLTQIGCSEHIPLYWLPEEARRQMADFAMDEAELENYVEAVYRAQSAYAGQISVRLGLEADMVPGHEAALQAILDRYPWDYVIGSCHFIGDWAMDYAPQQHRYAEWDLESLYWHYFDIICTAAGTGRFDFIGHLDLVKKFGHRLPGDPRRLYTEVAARLAAAGVAVEISTAGLRKPVGEIYPHPDLLAALNTAGVPITFASDAHAPDEVARDFDQALLLARRTGYREYATFARRARIMCPLSEA